MSKQLYEEVLADVRKVKELAEANAQRAVLEAVAPRIRELIETELMHDLSDEGDDSSVEALDPLSPAGVLQSGDDESGVEVVAGLDLRPDADGKVTLDLDAMQVDPAGAPVGPPMMGAIEDGDDDEFELSLESVKALAPILNATSGGAARELELRIYRLGDVVGRFKNAGTLVRESTGYQAKIVQMIGRVEDMYDYVQESIVDPAVKSSHETKLEAYFKQLTKLQEQPMSKRNKKMMNEEDVTLKLTGLPDDIDLDSVGVDLITGEEDGDDAGLDGEEGGGDEELDLGGGADDDLDLGGDESGGDEGEEDNMGESRRLSDDTIVEIDEGMLRREISRMRRLREEAVPSVAGHRPGSKEADDFGGGSIEGETLDADIVDLSDAPGARPLGEADEDDQDLDESDQDQMDEMDDLDQKAMDEMDDDLDQLGVKRNEEEHGTAVADGHETPHTDMPMESVKRRLSFEKRLQERAQQRARSLKKEAARAGSRRDARKVALLKREYAQVARRFNESVTRAKKLTRMLVESTKRPQSGSRLNGNPTRSAESRTVNSLRAKLAETNLNNAKLAYTNKLLQNEQLSARQKAKVIEQLDSVRTVREAKLVYESLSRTLAGTSKPMNESRSDRQVIGSSSRVTRPASTQSLNEGYEADRWARLAGIVK